MSKRYEIIYECFGDTIKIARLFRSLFGHRVRIKRSDGTHKTYVYDGILAGWKKVGNKYVRVRIVQYEKHGQAVLSIPENPDIRDRVLRAFEEHDVDHRIISYKVYS